MQTELSRDGNLCSLDVAPPSDVTANCAKHETKPSGTIEPPNSDSRSETLSDDRSIDNRSDFCADYSSSSLLAQSPTDSSEDEKEAMSSPSNLQPPRFGRSLTPSLQGIGRTMLNVAVDSSTSIAYRFLPSVLHLGSRSGATPSSQPVVEGRSDASDLEHGLLNERNLSAFSRIPDGTQGDQVAVSQLDMFLERIQSMDDMIRTRVHVLQSGETTGDTEWVRDANDRQNVRSQINGLISQTVSIRHVFPQFSGRFLPLQDDAGGDGMISSLLTGSAAAVFEHVSHELFPFFQDFVVETWDFLREVLEYYDPDPKHNVFLRTIEKVNEVIAAIQSLYVLSECYFEELESFHVIEQEAVVCALPPPPCLESEVKDNDDENGEDDNYDENESLSDHGVDYAHDDIKSDETMPEDSLPEVDDENEMIASRGDTDEKNC